MEPRSTRPHHQLYYYYYQHDYSYTVAEHTPEHQRFDRMSGDLRGTLLNLFGQTSLWYMRTDPTYLVKAVELLHKEAPYLCKWLINESLDFAGMETSYLWTASTIC